MRRLITVKLYLLINKAIYDTEEKNIAFALSFMKEGSAAIWASTLTKKALSLPTPSLGSWTAFHDNFKTSFVHIDVKNEAIASLTTTSVTKNLPLGDYISQFKNHIALSEITHEDTLINFFSRGIPAPLMKRIYGMDTVPTTIDEWYTRALHFKTQWDRADAIASKKPQFKEATLTTKAQKPIHMPWTSPLSALKSLPKKKGKNASGKANAFDAGNPDITQEIAPLSKATMATLSPTQGTKKISRTQESSKNRRSPRSATRRRSER